MPVPDKDDSPGKGDQDEEEGGFLRAGDWHGNGKKLCSFPLWKKAINISFPFLKNAYF
jgi:hypothetical protein